MTIAQLEYFITIVENKTYLEASEILNISQSSLSKNIIRLEKELGIILFDRSRRNVSLTKAGEIFYQDSLNLINNYNKMIHHINEYKSTTYGTIHLATLPILSQYNIQIMIKDFVEKNPNISVVIDEMEDVKILNQLKENLCDMAIIRKDCIKDNTYNYHTITTDELVLITSQSHEFSNNKSVSLSELANERFIFMPHHISLYNLCVNACIDNGFEPNIIRTARMETIFNAVALGEGVSLLMKKSIEIFNHSNVTIIPLNEKITSEIILTYNKKKLNNNECMLMKMLTSSIT